MLPARVRRLSSEIVATRNGDALVWQADVKLGEDLVVEYDDGRVWPGVAGGDKSSGMITTYVPEPRMEAV